MNKFIFIAVIFIGSTTIAQASCVSPNGRPICDSDWEEERASRDAISISNLFHYLTEDTPKPVYTPNDYPEYSDDSDYDNYNDNYDTTQEYYNGYPLDHPINQPQCYSGTDCDY